MMHTWNFAKIDFRLFLNSVVLFLTSYADQLKSDKYAGGVALIFILRGRASQLNYSLFLCSRYQQYFESAIRFYGIRFDACEPGSEFHKYTLFDICEPRSELCESSHCGSIIGESSLCGSSHCE